MKNKKIIMITVKFKDLNKQYRMLLTAAEKAAKTSYCPYSRFAVGAALLTRNGRIITGSNVENASYRLTVCAEQAAIARANALGQRHFKAVAVIARGGNSSDRPIAPCGACRQMLFEFFEFSGIDLEVIMSDAGKKRIVIAKISELLPLAFGPKDL